MGQVLHASTTTKHAVRAAIQRSQASAREMSDMYGVDQEAILKCSDREAVDDCKTGPKEPVQPFSAKNTRRSFSPSAVIRCCRWTTASMPFK